METEMSETVYGTHEDGHVMSERVQTLAASIYKEFERMIKKYDEDVVKELMPLTVSILESLDQSYQERQENEVELELLRDDNEQLLTQYEREKQLRKGAEQKYLEIEDQIEDEQKELQSKVESLESIVRMFELKAKNAQDHVARLEDKESENKKEYTKLHERYTELFRTHMDYMERTKILVGASNFGDGGSAPGKGKGGFVLPNLRPVSQNLNYSMGDTPTKTGSPMDAFSLTSPDRGRDSSTSLRNELDLDADSKGATKDVGQLTDTIDVKSTSTGTSDGLHPLVADIVASTPELEEIDESFGGLPKSQGKGKDENQSSIFDELNFHDASEVDDGADITDSEHDDHESNGMGKEVENLILENQELLATKNALNVVKDDLIAKVDELTSEQEILRQEIQSLQAVKSRLKQRVTELEEELKKTKEELEKKASTAQADEEEDIPMAQRKRFTRVEMARVLMERNQYKERLMELQEAVRWTEMIRASREHPDLCAASSTKKKSSIWNFFSNLFSSSNKPSKKPLPSATVRYNAPTTQVQPVGDPNRRNRDKYNLGKKSQAFDFMADDGSGEKGKKERERERREQYKQVRAHVKKDDGRMTAYGWSLPAKLSPMMPKDHPGKTHVPVPVPVYCRPLLDKQTGMKIWCAAGVNLEGGKTKDGGSVVGASVFYSNPPAEDSNKREATKDDVEKLNQELKAHENDIKEIQDQKMSSLVWICTTAHASSRVTVIDANNPADVLESFHVTSSHILCIASVPGAKQTDYSVEEELLKGEQESPAQKLEGKAAETENQSPSSIGGITFVQCATGATSKTTSSATTPVGTPDTTNDLSEGAPSSVSSAVTQAAESLSQQNTAGSDSGSEKKDTEEDDSDLSESVAPGGPPGTPADPLGAAPADNICATVIKATGSPASSGTTTPTSSSSGSEKRLLREPTDTVVKDGISAVPTDNDFMYVEAEKMSSVMPTMWLGSQSGSLYVHSAVSQWKRCLHSVKLRDSILNIVHVKGRVMVALADGTVAIFHRDLEGQWDLTNYHLLDLGRPHHSIRCMVVVANKQVWCGYRNKIHVVDPKTMAVEKTFDAHPRKESQVRQMGWVGDGVWVSIRLDSTLRLYHAYTHEHLQDVDIEPYVSKMLGTGKLGFSFVRITSLLVSCNRLWIGTGNGVIISVPLSESTKQQVTQSKGGPGGVIRVYGDSKTDSVTPGSFIPFCSMAQAQLSFHGHRDAVKFFVAVPGAPTRGLSAATAEVDNKTVESNKKKSKKPEKPKNKNMLVISGGEGYIDFRIGDSDDDEAASALITENTEKKSNKSDRSHLIVWHVAD